MLTPTVPAPDFELPKKLLESVPTEIRGIKRDEVQLLVSKITTDAIFHTEFSQIDRFLQPGDVLVANTSATIPAALDIILPTGTQGRLHLSNRIDNKTWRAELRELINGKPKRYFLGQPGDTFPLAGGGQATLERLFYGNTTDTDHLQLWEIRLDLPEDPFRYLTRYGRPIRYDERDYPIEYYQTAFSSEAGSAEMPSAGRAFTHPLITRLLVMGVQFAPITLHTGVSSLETNELPFPEFFRVPPVTAGIINLAKKQGRRIVAVGTTAVRAVESALNEEGRVVPRQGWTELYITPEVGLRVIDGLLTGFHEPQASHLHMLEALAGRRHIEKAYRAALEKQYFWHEFGDLHLIL